MGWGVGKWEGQGGSGEAEEDGLGLHNDGSGRAGEEIVTRLGGRETQKLEQELMPLKGYWNEYRDALGLLLCTSSGTYCSCRSGADQKKMMKTLSIQTIKKRNHLYMR